jgi:thiol:disulfide interchange protein DsbD
MRRLIIMFLTLVTTSGSAWSQQADTPPVTVSAQIKDGETVAPGQTVTVEIIAEITDQPDSKGKHWHIYPRRELHQGPETPTSMTVTSSSLSLTPGHVSWPAPKVFRNAAGQFQPAYEGRVVFTVPVDIAVDAVPGEHVLKIDFTYQTCASLCLPPATVPLTVAIVVPGEVPAPAETPAPGEVDSTRSGTRQSSGEPSTSSELRQVPLQESETPRSAKEDFETSLFGAQFGFSASNRFAVPMLLLFAALGGFLLNLTPCVLPVIPIKIVGLTQSTSGDSRRMKMLGLAMGFGILAFWLAIGAAISFVSGFDSISALFQRPVFGIAVGLFIGVMGVGMLVDLAVRLPQAVYRINPGHDTLPGAFGFGVMTAVLSTPCTAPFMGSAAAWATRAGNPVLILSVFASIAIGMGLPYVALSWYPGWLKRLPRTGPASVLVKQTMGLLMLGVAAFFAGTGLLGLLREHPHLGPVLHWWLATVCVGAAALWLIVQTFRITSSTWKRAFWSGTSLLLFVAMVSWSRGETADSYESTELKQAERDSLLRYVRELEQRLSGGPADQPVSLMSPAWREYSGAALASAKARGQVAIVHFTADW